jgi:hypothetical protein
MAETRYQVVSEYVGMFTQGDILTAEQMEAQGWDAKQAVKEGTFRELSATAAKEAEADVVAMQTEGDPPAQPLDAPAATTSKKSK